MTGRAVCALAGGLLIAGAVIVFLPLAAGGSAGAAIGGAVLFVAGVLLLAFSFS